MVPLWHVIFPIRNVVLNDNYVHSTQTTTASFSSTDSELCCATGWLYSYLMYLFWSCSVDGVCSSLSKRSRLRASILVSTSAYTAGGRQRQKHDWKGKKKTKSYDWDKMKTFFEDWNLCVAKQRLGFLVVIDHHVVISLGEEHKWRN